MDDQTVILPGEDGYYVEQNKLSNYSAQQQKEPRRLIKIGVERPFEVTRMTQWQSDVIEECMTGKKKPIMTRAEEEKPGLFRFLGIFLMFISVVSLISLTAYIIK